jgi:Saxitoxin biosynthesis operon protein SxtJ
MTHEYAWFDEVVMWNNTKFGLVLFGVCALVYGFGVWSGHPSHPAWLIAAGIFLAITLTIPRILEPLRRQWMRLGGLLHVVVSPVLLGLFFYTVVTPVGLCLRLMSKDPLRLKRGATTYWVERDPPGPEPRTMTEVY